MNLTRKLGKPRFLMVYPMAVWVLLTAHTTPAFLQWGVVIVLIGGLIRVWANGYVGHMKVNWQPEGAAKIGHLITAGPYAFIRHPLYFGSLLIGLGMLVIAGNPEVGLLVPVVFAVIYRKKMQEEERILGHEWPEEFATYQRAVPRWWPTWRRYPHRYGRWSWRGIVASKELKTSAWVGVVLIVLFFRWELIQQRLPPRRHTVVLLGLALVLAASDGIAELLRRRRRAGAARSVGTHLATLLACCVAWSLHGCAMARPRRHAEALPHFVRIDDGLLRGAQPSPDGVRQLAGMGVKTIVNLRGSSTEGQRERALAEQLGMRWVGIPVWAWGRPSEAQVRQFLAIAENPAQRPVFVHCRFGKNRTGVMTAAYRIAHDGWTRRQAFVEARRLGLAPWNLLSRQMILHTVPAPASTLPASPAP